MLASTETRQERHKQTKKEKKRFIYTQCVKIQEVIAGKNRTQNTWPAASRFTPAGPTVYT